MSEYQTPYGYIMDGIDVCECIGQFDDEYVYDIEVDDDTHTFVANDILIHNSLYITFSPLAKACGYDGDMLKFIHHVNGVFIKFKFTELLDIYAAKYGVENLHDFELETINASGLHIAKKMYINNCVWEDGVHYDNLTKLYPKGVQIVRSSTPLFVREKIPEFLNYLFGNADNLSIKEILKIMKNIKKEYMITDIEDISSTTSCSNYHRTVMDDQSNLEIEKGAHFGVKAAALHNYLLNKNSSYKTRYDTIRNGKIKYYCCKHPMGKKFAYMRSFHPTEIVSKEGVEVDYDEQFASTFISICNSFLDPIGLPLINKRLSVLNNLFSFDKTKVVNPDVPVVEVDEEFDGKVIGDDDGDEFSDGMWD